MEEVVIEILNVEKSIQKTIISWLACNMPTIALKHILYQ